MRTARYLTPYKAPTFENLAPSLLPQRCVNVDDGLWLFRPKQDPDAEVKMTVLKERPPGNPLNVTFNFNHGDMTLFEKKD